MIRIVLGLLNPDPFLQELNPDPALNPAPNPSIIKLNSKKNLISIVSRHFIFEK
jgi:hypothetical protein